MLNWLAPDRAALKFSSISEFKAKRPEFVSLIRCWIKHV